MAYTLTQARPLLNAAELELFEQSRAEPVKQLAPAKLAGALKRTRTLRDKYRDLYQRQTVAVRTSTPGAVTGDDNGRTQRKADILQEVLERYEARASLLQEQGSSSNGKKEKADGKTGSPRSKVPAQAPEDQGGRKKPAVSQKKSASTAAARKAAPGAAAAVSADKGTAQTGKSAKAVKAVSAGKGSKSAPSAAGKGKGSSAGTRSQKPSASSQLNTLAGAGARASAAGTGSATRSQPKAGTAPARSPKAPSRKAPTAGNKAAAPPVNAPLDTVASAKRASPLKQKPANLAVQAHQSSSGRRTQGKRDSR